MPVIHAEHSDRYAALELPFVLSDMEFHMSASIGVGLYPLDGGDGHALMKQGDAAMYRNKRERSGFASVDGRRLTDVLKGEHDLPCVRVHGFRGG